MIFVFYGFKALINADSHFVDLKIHKFALGL